MLWKEIEMNINRLKEKIRKGPRGVFVISRCVYQSFYCMKGIFKIRRDLSQYSRLNRRKSFSYQKKYRWFIDDSGGAAGTTSSYYWQDLWAATKIIESRPEIHYDIGSRVDGFIAHLQAAKIKTNLIDIRPLDNKLPYVGFTQADATSLEGIPDGSIESLSALCSLEHFGLGRYGDPVDPEACFKAFQAIQRVLKSGGHCYLSVPIGKEHLEFNAQRVFYAKTVIDAFNDCDLVELCSNTLEKEMKIIKIGNVCQFDHEIDNSGNRFGLFEFVKR